jgi:hypothetical protein
VASARACGLALAPRHRTRGRDFRRLLFAKQLEYLAAVKIEWAEAKRHEFETILKEHPFEDDGAAEAGAASDHCIFGYPPGLVTFSPSWRTDTAVAIARQMSASRDFSAMPIFADAFQDAGCDTADILNHCRGSFPHDHGCWVLDLVIGRG